MTKTILLLFLFCAGACVAVWAVVGFAGRNSLRQSASVTNLTKSSGADSWALAVEKVKADRGETAGGNAAVETPSELKHYSERYWFLATQIAEIEKHNVHTFQDYLDLAQMVQSGEMVPVPAVTDSFVLFGVGEKADDAVFSRYEQEPHNEAELDQSDGRPDSGQKPGRDYESLQTLAKNFAGRSYDITNPSDRQALKVNILSSLRPQALKIMEEVAAAYYRQFARPLPVSSLVRPEQYQHALRRVNRNAVLIDTPPHSTGLAFDIDYRYMSAAEQAFVMAELARLKNEGRIEVIRERNANYHVFAFINGTRPADDLIAASLEKAGAPVQETHHAVTKSARVKQKARNRTVKARRPRANVRKRRH